MLLFLVGFIIGTILPILPIHISINYDVGYSDHNIKRFFYIGIPLYIFEIIFIVYYEYNNVFSSGIMLSAIIMLVVMFLFWYRKARYL